MALTPWLNSEGKPLLIDGAPVYCEVGPCCETSVPCCGGRALVKDTWCTGTEPFGLANMDLIVETDFGSGSTGVDGCSNCGSLGPFMPPNNDGGTLCRWTMGDDTEAGFATFCGGPYPGAGVYGLLDVIIGDAPTFGVKRLQVELFFVFQDSGTYIQLHKFYRLESTDPFDLRDWLSVPFFGDGGLNSGTPPACSEMPPLIRVRGVDP